MSLESIEKFIEKVSANKAAGTAVYFLGLGGIGMSALARYFSSRGVRVFGYDKTKTVLTAQLEQEGIVLHYEDDVQKICKEAELVVYTPAIPKDHKEYNYYLQNGYNLFKRSEVLGLITKSSFNICVAGTHGKTTTSTMIAHILRHSEYGCNAFLGGIASNYGTNFWSSSKNVSVVEADEYDRSFLQLSPSVAVITAMDPDHLDIYETAENFRSAFVDFSSKVRPDGLLISRSGLEKENQFKALHRQTYSISDQQADGYAMNITRHNGSYQFDVNVSGHRISGLELNMGGMHNVENAVAAIAVARYAGIDDEKIRRALADFKGVKRRFEYVIKTDSLVMIDDYAHHPEELTALIGSAKELFPGKKCTVVFQPHLYSRTRDFAEGFAAALDLADEIFLLPIYPAREKPIEGVNSELVANGIKSEKVKVCSKEALINEMRTAKRLSSAELIITCGAGDIDTLVEPIKEIFES